MPRLESARSLDGIAGRSYVAGVISNTPEHLIQWIENPQAIDNKTAMPNMGVTERDARTLQPISTLSSSS